MCYLYSNRILSVSRQEFGRAIPCWLTIFYLLFCVLFCLLGQSLEISDCSISSLLINPGKRFPRVTHSRNKGRCSWGHGGLQAKPFCLCYQIMDLTDKTKANELTRFASDSQFYLSHILVLKGSNLRKDPVSYTPVPIDVPPSSSSWAKTTPLSPGLYLSCQ